MLEPWQARSGAMHVQPYKQIILRLCPIAKPYTAIACVNKLTSKLLSVDCLLIGLSFYCLYAQSKISEYNPENLLSKIVSRKRLMKRLCCYLLV